MESIFGGYVFFEFLRLESIFLAKNIYFVILRLIFNISVRIIENTLLSWLNIRETSRNL